MSSINQFPSAITGELVNFHQKELDDPAKRQTAAEQLGYDTFESVQEAAKQLNAQLQGTGVLTTEVSAH